MQLYKKIISYVLLILIYFSGITYAKNDNAITSFEEFTKDDKEENIIDLELDNILKAGLSKEVKIDIREEKLPDKEVKEPINNSQAAKNIPSTKIISQNQITKPSDLSKPILNLDFDKEDDTDDNISESYDEMVDSPENQEYQSQELLDKKNSLSNKENNDDDEEEDVKKEYISECNTAEIVVLNKITAKATTIILKKDSSEYCGNIEIKMYKCVKNTDPYNPDNMAFLRIIENKLEDDPKVIFQGWIISSSNSLSGFEHPVYDIIVKTCFNNNPS